MPAHRTLRLLFNTLLALLAWGSWAHSLAQSTEEFRAQLEARRRLTAPLYTDCDAKEVAFLETTPQAMLDGIPGVIPGRARGNERMVRTLWTGACVEGKLDGLGSLEIAHYTAPGSSFAIKPMTTREKGQIVRGVRVGPWLVEAAPSPALVGTYRWYDAPVPGSYIRLADGAMQLASNSWENGGALKPVTTSVPIPAAEVARLTELARQAALGNTVKPQRAPYRSTLLADLLRGGEVFRSASTKLVDAQNATLAVVLTSRAEKSLAAIQELSKITTQWANTRAEPQLKAAALGLAQALDSKAVTQGLVDLLRERFGKVVFAEDLGAVDRKAVAYTLIFDFAFQHGGQATLDGWLQDTRTRVKLDGDQLLRFNQQTPAHALRTGVNFFLLDRQFDVMLTQESEPQPIGISRPTPYLSDDWVIDEAKATRELTAFIQMETTLVKNVLGGHKFNYVDGKRQENFGASTYMLRAILEEASR